MQPYNSSVARMLDLCSGMCLTILGYLKDNNAAAHSIDSDIFYAVIHLQLHA